MLGLVLAGGQSSRMGTDKAMLRPFGPDGPTLLEHAVRTLLAIAPGCLVSCAKGRPYAGYACVEDVAGPPGPAKGLYAGLLQARNRGFKRVIALACDLPLLGPEPLARLCAQHGGPYATLYVNERTGRVEMLAGIYSTAFLPLLADGLARGMRSLYWLLPQSGRRLLRYGAALEPIFANCNTPADLARLQSS